MPIRIVDDVFAPARLPDMAWLGIPQVFKGAQGKGLHPIGKQGQRFEQAKHTQALESQRKDEAQIQSDYLALKPLEQAVLLRMLERGSRFRPYDADALRFYNSSTGLPATPAQAL